MADRDAGSGLPAGPDPGARATDPTDAPTGTESAARSALVPIVRVLVVAVVGLLLTAGATALSLNQARAREDADARRSLEAHALSVQAAMNAYAEVLYGLRGAMVSNGGFDRASFSDAVEASEALTRLKGVRSLQWITTVPLDGAAQFEAEANADPLADGSPPPPTVVHPPLEKPLNYVVEYVEPLEQNVYALGLNLSALPVRDESIEDARDTNELVTTPPLELILADGPEVGFVQFLPVYSEADVPLAVELRRDRFRGVMGGVFAAQDMFAPVGSGAPDFDTAIYDTGSLGGGSSEPTLLAESTAGLDVQRAFESETIRVGDRLWTVYYIGDVPRDFPLGASLVALGGLLATGLLVLYVWSTGRYRQQSGKYIDELRASERRLQDLSISDPLTGLPNRRGLLREMGTMAELAQRTGSAMVVLFIDVDSFKGVNDRYGHRAGDSLLVDISRRLTQAVRKADLVGRLAGDEFCVAGLVGGRDAAEDVAARVQARLSEPYQVNGQDTAVASSIGGTLVRQREADIEAMLDAADHAMYESKNRGRGQVVWFDDDLDERRSEEARVGGWLREAVEEDRFALVYQPVMDTAGRRVAQVEALLRLTPSGEDDQVRPDRFIDVAERTRLIRPLGQKVIRRAISDRAEWQRRNPGGDTVLALNISASQAADPATGAAIQQGLAESGLSPHLLAVELTETSLFGSGTETEDFLAGMRELGVGLSIDDYGVGYSNLSAMLGLGADTLKIDRSLVAGIGESPAAREILALVAQAAPLLGLAVLAEGVESASQYQALRELGIDLMQGFAFARPLGSFSAAAEVGMPDGW